MLITPRVSEPLECSDVPTAQAPFHAQPTGGGLMHYDMGEAEGAHAHEHHHPAMTTGNTTVKTIPTSACSSRSKSPSSGAGAVYIHRCPFQNCTHGRRYLQQQPLEADEAEPCEDSHTYHIQDSSYHTSGSHQEQPSAYTSVITSEDLLASCQGYEERQELSQLRNYSWSDPGSPSSPCEGGAVSPLDEWHTRDDSYITTTQDNQYTHPRYTTSEPKLLSRGLNPSAHTRDTSFDEPSAMGAKGGPRKFPKVSMGYRQRAIDCMLRQLRVSSDSSDPNTIQVIKQTVNQLEDQLYHHANTKDEYQLLVASKLYAILQQLAERQQRSTSPVRYQGPSPTLRT